MQKTVPLSPDFGFWADQLATIFSGTANCDQAEQLVALYREVCNFDHCVIFTYIGEQAPICLFDTFSSEQRRSFVTEYQAGPYLLDPFYKASYDKIEPGLYGIRELAPDHFFLSEYFLSYYRNMGLADELGYFVQVDDQARIVLSLMREGSKNRFSREEKQMLSILNTVTQSFLTNLWCQSFQHHQPTTQDNDQEDINRRLEQTFINFGSQTLTQREQQITQLLLRGHSSASISNELSISVGTVKIHRKNIYSKLRISSHSELFSRFLASLASGEPLQSL